jgi:hypothetical protein
MIKIIPSIHRKPLYAPMLSTFGGGSIRGFHQSGGGGGGLYDFTSFTFLNSDQSRTESEVSGTSFISGAGYNTSTYPWINDTNFYSVTSGFQTWTVPETATYRIECRGGKGTDSSSALSSSSGNGARMRADFNLTEGDKFVVVVGYSGKSPGSGGGASFVMTVGGVAPTNLGYLSNYTDKRPLIIAGGGGGDWSHSGTYSNAPTSPNGNRSSTNSHISNNGDGGVTSTGSYGGGAGFYTDGSGSTTNADGQALRDGAEGGDRGATYFGTFGGGGAAIGGGGGYSGGSAGSSPYSQGGGGSFISSVTTGTGVGTSTGGSFQNVSGNLRSGDSIWTGTSASLGYQNYTGTANGFGPKVIIEKL